MSTLAEAKAELGHVQILAELHEQGCAHCQVKRRGPGCDEARELRARARELREEIRIWFAPPPGAATLFGGDGP